MLIHPDTFLSTAICWLGSHMLARSGQQLYVTDEYSEEDRRPLLEVMADPCKYWVGWIILFSILYPPSLFLLLHGISAIAEFRTHRIVAVKANPQPWSSWKL